MIQVCILGAGNVGHFFIEECLEDSAIELVQIYNRSLNSIQQYRFKTSITNETTSLLKADIYVICLPDDIIKTIDLSSLEGLVVHTSGTKPFNEIQSNKRGVLYPLQSFSKGNKIDVKNIPLCIETEFIEDEALLESFASSISNNVQILKGHQREKLHLAAVFANNFSNRMMSIAYDICHEYEIDFCFLQPLLKETFEKIKSISPEKAQTGPALRRDQTTIDKHLAQLSGIEKEIYQLITQSIQEKNGKKL